MAVGQLWACLGASSVGVMAVRVTEPMQTGDGCIDLTWIVGVREWMWAQSDVSSDNRRTSPWFTCSVLQT